MPSTACTDIMSDEVLEEEMQVLESIYPTEITKISEREVQLNVEPEEDVEGGMELKLLLKVFYPEDYPEVLPELKIEPTAGDLRADEMDSLVGQLKTVGEENLGMAMTFTLVSHLREQLLELVKSRMEKRRKEAKEKERSALEEEEARTRGTPVTKASFMAWRAKFDREIAQKKAREEEERLKGLSPKEREEFKKLHTRLSGRQLFERNRYLEDDASLFEEGTVSVDPSQYEHTNDREEEEEPERLELSDSD